MAGAFERIGEPRAYPAGGVAGLRFLPSNRLDPRARSGPGAS